MKPGTGRKTTDVEAQAPDSREMPVLDESTFQQILEAAFVIQEQHQPKAPAAPPRDATATLAEIAETQQLLRAQNYDLSAAANLLAERLEKITGATGVVIALVREDQLEYCAATGTASALAGSKAVLDSELSAFLKDGANQQLSSELLQKREQKSPVFIPIYHDAKISGFLQLSFSDAAPLHDLDLRSCQLMAGLMGEAIARASELEWKQALAAERATMVQALEQLRPQLERLAKETNKVTESPREATPAVKPPSPPPPPASEELPELIAALNSAAPNLTASSTCQCGYQFGEGEMFCGRCGSPRAMSGTSEIELPEDIASLLREPEPQLAPSQAVQPPSSPAKSEIRIVEELPPELEAVIAQLEAEEKASADTQVPEASSKTIEAAPSTPAWPGTPQPSFEFPKNEPAPEKEVSLATRPKLEPVHPPPPVEEATPDFPAQEEPVEAQPATPALETEAAPQPQLELVKPVSPPSPFSSAAKARKWLNSLEEANSPARIWLHRHRADVWIGVSVILLVFALSGWGTHSVNYPGQAKASPQPSLSLFEKMLVSLGLAEVPPAPVYLGNPNVQVWVDLHTALYYCPGSDLYGKTPGGKYTTQRDAQLDQFEPAARKNCE